MPEQNLAAEIFKMFEDRGAPRSEGNHAIMIALAITLIAEGFDKEEALKMVSKVWDHVEHTIARTESGAGHA